MGAMVAARLNAADVRFEESGDVTRPRVTCIKSGEHAEGLAAVMRYVARSGKAEGAGSGMYGRTALEACQIDSLVDFVDAQLVPGSGFDVACAALNTFLSSRTYLSGREI